MDKIFTIKERIILYLENKRISKSSFFDKTGISPSNFKGIGRKSELGGDKIVKILTAYQDLSSDWLLLNHGPMLREQTIHQKEAYTSKQNTETVDLQRKQGYGTDIHPEKERMIIGDLLNRLEAKSTEIGRLAGKIETLQRENEELKRR
jgi:hypothetical protein